MRVYEPGDIVELAGTKFVVLDTIGREDETQDLFILTMEAQGESKFGGSNDYSVSKLREAVGDWLMEFVVRLTEDGAHPEREALIREREISLETLDGYKGYQNFEVMAAPLTLDEARMYAEFIPDPDIACWLTTGWGGPEHFGSANALLVGSGGSWYGSGCSNSYGIRPALIISSLCLVSDDKPDLSEYSNNDLLAELRRRTGCRIV